MDQRVSWIQLTDLHFGDSEQDQSAQRKLLDNIRISIKKHKNITGINPEILFVTGDFIKPAKPDGLTNDELEIAIKNRFKVTIQQLDQFVTDMQEDGIHILKVYACPGNHDVARHRTDPSLEALLEKLNSTTGTTAQGLLYRDEIAYAFSDESSYARTCSKWMTHLEIYKEAVSNTSFCRKFVHGTHLPDLSYIDIYESNRCKHDGSQIRYRILSLNTAWACANVNSHMPAIPTCARQQIHRLLLHDSSNGEFDATIVLSHHPLGWMWPQERMVVREELQRHAEFHLRGHEHVDWIDPSQSSVIEIAVGATASHTDLETPQHFAIVEHDLITRNVRIFVMELLDEKTGEFVPKHKQGVTTSDGAWLTSVDVASTNRYDGLNSQSASRHLGTPLHSDLELLSGGCIGPVVSIDIARFSSLDSKQQLDAANKLRAIVTKILHKNNSTANRYVVSSHSDGMQISFIGPELHEHVNLAVYAMAFVSSLSSQLLNEAGYYEYRFGVSYGPFSVVANANRTYATSVGPASSIARRLSLMVDPWCVGVCSSVLRYLLECDKESAKKYMKKIFKYDDDKRKHELLLFPIPVMTTEPHSYAVFVPQSAKMTKRSRLQSAESRLHEAENLFARYMSDLPRSWDAHIVVYSKWDSNAAGSKLSPMLVYSANMGRLDVVCGNLIEFKRVAQLFTAQSITEQTFLTNDIVTLESHVGECADILMPDQQSKYIELGAVACTQVGSDQNNGCVTLWVDRTEIAEVAEIVLQSSAQELLGELFDSQRSLMYKIQETLNFKNAIL